MLIDFIYLFKKFNIQPKGILHCGSSTCQESDMYNILNIPAVIWVEAIYDVYKEAEKKIAKYPNQIAVNACIGDEDGRDVIFHVSNNEAQSSSYLEFGLHREAHPTVYFTHDIPMKTTRVDTLLDRVGVGRFASIDFGNYDLQGNEMAALKGMGKYMHQFNYFYLEVNKKETYKECALVGDIDAFLVDFERVETSEFVADLWGDALFIRRSLLP